MYFSTNSRYVLSRAKSISSRGFFECWKGGSKNFYVKCPSEDPTKPPLRLNIPKDQKKQADGNFVTNRDSLSFHTKEFSQPRSRSLVTRPNVKHSFSSAFEDDYINIHKSESENQLTKSKYKSDLFNETESYDQQNFNPPKLTPSGKMNKSQIKNNTEYIDIEPLTDYSQANHSKEQLSRYQEQDFSNAAISKNAQASKLDSKVRKWEPQTHEPYSTLGNTFNNAAKSQASQEPQDFYIVVDIPQEVGDRQGDQSSSESFAFKISDKNVIAKNTSKRSANSDAEWGLIKEKTNLINKSPKLEGYKKNSKVKFEVHEIGDASTFILHLKLKKNFQTQGSSIECVPEKEMNTRTLYRNSGASCDCDDTFMSLMKANLNEGTMGYGREAKKARSRTKNETAERKLRKNKYKDMKKSIGNNKKEMLNIANSFKKEENSVWENQKQIENDLRCRDDLVFVKVFEPPTNDKSNDQSQWDSPKETQQALSSDKNENITNETQMLKLKPHENKPNYVNDSLNSENFQSSQLVEANSTGITIQDSCVGVNECTETNVKEFQKDLESQRQSDKTKVHLTEVTNKNSITTEEPCSQPFSKNKNIDNRKSLDFKRNTDAKLSDEKNNRDASSESVKFKFQPSPTLLKVSSEKPSMTYTGFGAAFPPNLNEIITNGARRFGVQREALLKHKWNSKVIFRTKEYENNPSYLNSVDELTNNSIFFPKSDSKKLDSESIFSCSCKEKSRGKDNFKKTSNTVSNPPNDDTFQGKVESSADSLTIMKKVKEIVDFDLKNASKIFGETDSPTDTQTDPPKDPHTDSQTETLNMTENSQDKNSLNNKMSNAPDTKYDDHKSANNHSQIPLEVGDGLDTNFQLPKLLPGFKSEDTTLKVTSDSVVVYNPENRRFEINTLEFEDAIKRSRLSFSEAYAKSVMKNLNEILNSGFGNADSIMYLASHDNNSSDSIMTYEMKSGDSILIFDELTQTWRVDYSILEKRQEKEREEEELNKRSEFILETFEKLEKSNITKIPTPGSREKKVFDYKSKEWKTYEEDKSKSNEKSPKNKHPFKESDAEEIRKKNSDLYENLFVANKKNTTMISNEKQGPGSSSTKTSKEEKNDGKIAAKAADSGAKNSDSKNTDNKNTENKGPTEKSDVGPDVNTPKPNPVTNVDVAKTDDDFWGSFIRGNIPAFDIPPLQKKVPDPVQPPKKITPNVPEREPKLKIPHPLKKEEKIKVVDEPKKKEEKIKVVDEPKKKEEKIKVVDEPKKKEEKIKVVDEPKKKEEKIKVVDEPKKKEEKKIEEKKIEQKKIEEKKIEKNIFKLPSFPIHKKKIENPSQISHDKPVKKEPSQTPKSTVPEPTSPPSSTTLRTPDKNKPDEIDSSGMKRPQLPPPPPKQPNIPKNETPALRDPPPSPNPPKNDPPKQNPSLIGKSTLSPLQASKIKDPKNTIVDKLTTKPSASSIAIKKDVKEHYISKNIVEMVKSTAKDKNTKLKVETVKLNITSDNRAPSKIKEINLNKRSEESIKNSDTKFQKTGGDQKSSSTDSKKKNEKCSLENRTFYRNFEKYKTPFSDPEYEEKSIKIKSDIESNPNLKKLDNYNKTLVLHDIVKPPDNMEIWLKDETDKMASLLLKVLQEATDGKPKKKVPPSKGKSSEKLGKGNPYDNIRKKQETNPDRFLFKVRDSTSDIDIKVGNKKSETNTSKTRFELKNLDKPSKDLNPKEAKLISSLTPSQPNVRCIFADQKPKLTELNSDIIEPTSALKDPNSNKVSEFSIEIPGPEILKKIANAWKLFPLIGCQITVFLLARIFQLGKSKKDAFGKLFAKYGPIVNLQGPLSGNVILINKPEHFAALLEQDNASQVRSLFDSLEQSRKEIDENSLANVVPTDWTKPEWNILRKATVDPLKIGHEKYFKTLERAGDSLLSNIRRNKNGQNFASDDFIDEIKRWSLEGLCETLLSRNYNFLEGRSTNLSWLLEPEKLFTAIDEATTYLCKCEKGFQLWRLIGTPSSVGLGQAYRSLATILTKHVIQAEVNLKNKNEQILDNPTLSSQDVTFIEGMVLNDGMSTEEIICNLSDILVLGSSAMSSSLGFLLYHLSQNVKAQNRLVNEVKTVLPHKNSRLDINKLRSLKYLQACLKETFRLNMPFPLFFRFLQNDVLLSNYIIPKGALVVMDARVSSMREQLFDEPEKFIPERWLEEEKWMQNVLPFSSFPLCHGPRAELAKQIVELQICSCLAKIVRNFEIEYHFGEIHGTENVISFPNRPLKFSFIERND